MHSTEHPELEHNNDIIQDPHNVLPRIQQLNAEGKHVLFAPNHLKPEKTLHKLMSMADDFGELKRAMKAHGIDVIPVMRNDLDMPVDTKIQEVIYKTHQKIFAVAGKWMTGGGIPVAINSQDPIGAVQSNVSQAKKIVDTLKEDESDHSQGRNVAIYPYGNWYNSGEQTFETEEALINGDSFAKMPDPKKDPDGFKVWRDSLKKGCFSAARLAQVPIVPVYVERNDKKWTISLGEPIDPPAARNDEIETAKSYLEAMRDLKINAAQEAGS